jgi:gamma-glutamyl:cysteine ligase YbdK (ATP-grasp superfamily)
MRQKNKELIGLELEFHLINPDGTLSNNSDYIFNDSRGKGFLIKELGKSMVEVISAPSENLNELHDNFINNLITFKDICDDYNLKAIPSTTIGPKSNPISNDPERIRGFRKRLILGNEKRDLEHHVCGTHIHYDHIDDNNKTYEQFIVMQAMDPIFILMSSSPFLFGKNTKKDYRVDVYRNDVFEKFPLQGQLNPYPKSYQDLKNRQIESFSQWIDLEKKNGYSDEGFNEYNTCWGPIRLTKKTIENRSSDATLFSNVMGLASLTQGINNYVINEDPNIIIDHNNSHSNKYFKEGSELILPSYEFLKWAEKTGIEEGLKNETLNKYVDHIITLAKKYTSNKDYLNVFDKQIKSIKSFSDDIINYANSNKLEHKGKITESGACKIRNYIADSYNKDLETMRL